MQAKIDEKLLKGLEILKIADADKCSVILDIPQFLS
jgi:hypothetical protein